MSDDRRRREEADDDQPDGDGSSRPSLFLVALIVVAAISVAFVLQNQDRATIRYLGFFDADLAVWTAIAVAIGLGILLDRLVILWWRRSRDRD